jgi:hypothetical protein
MTLKWDASMKNEMSSKNIAAYIFTLLSIGILLLITTTYFFGSPLIAATSNTSLIFDSNKDKT